MVCDAQGQVVLWNAACTRLFGYTEQEALGHSLDIIIPQAQRARHWQGYHHTMTSGVTQYGQSLLRVPALHKDGRKLSIALTVSLLRNSEGDVTAIVAVVRDETQRFTEEKALRQRILDLEQELKR